MTAYYYISRWGGSGWQNFGWKNQSDACSLISNLSSVSDSEDSGFAWFAIYSSSPVAMIGGKYLDHYQASSALCYGSLPLDPANSSASVAVPGWSSSLMESAPTPVSTPSPGPPPTNIPPPPPPPPPPVNVLSSLVPGVDPIVTAVIIGTVVISSAIILANR